MRLGIYIAIATALTLHAAPSYSVLDIGNVPFGGGIVPLSINNSGQITGQVQVSGGFHIFLYSSGSMQDLGTLAGYSRTYGVAINNLGQIVGHAWDGSDGFRAIYYDSGVGMLDLGSLGGIRSQSLDINDMGQIVGLTTDSSGNMRAFSTTIGNTMNDIGTLGGNSAFAHGINNHGDIVGTSFTSDGQSRAFLLPAGSASMTNLGSLSSSGASDAVAINESGQIAGYAETAPGTPGFLISGATMTNIGTLGGDVGYPYAINSSGIVVGSSRESSGNSRAFVYINGQMLNLNDLVTLSTELQSAYGINDSGQIVASGENGHAYLLTPLSAPVPEPVGVLLAGPALLGVFIWRARCCKQS